MSSSSAGQVIYLVHVDRYTVKPVLSGHSKQDQKLDFKTDYRLMQVKSIAECSKGSILQYFLPSLSYHLSLRSLFCLFLIGRLRQVLLYVVMQDTISSITICAFLLNLFFFLCIFFVHVYILMDYYTNPGINVFFLNNISVK